jgi:hypothetical protein
MVEAAAEAPQLAPPSNRPWLPPRPGTAAQVAGAGVTAAAAMPIANDNRASANDNRPGPRAMNIDTKASAASGAAAGEAAGAAAGNTFRARYTRDVEAGMATMTELGTAQGMAAGAATGSTAATGFRARFMAGIEATMAAGQGCHGSRGDRRRPRYGG